MKKLLIVIVLIIFGIGGYNLWRQSGLQSTPQSKGGNFSTLQIGDTKYLVEVADNDNARAQGLSDRPKLESNRGMLFIFDTKDTYSFWMKGMKFPLDFVWISDETVVDLTENVPTPLTDTYIPTIHPKTPVNKVLEINAGEIKRHGFTVGQLVTLTLLKPENTQ